MDEKHCDPSDPAVTVAVADATLRRLAVEQVRNDHAICHWLVRADELQVERVLGYGSIREYGERVFGFGGRAVEDRLRVGRALRELPRLNEGFENGELRYTTVRELCRVTTAETEAEWIAAASGRTGTEVARMVAAREPGDRPTDPGDDRIVPRRVTLTLSPQAYALLETARSEATRGAGEHVDDSAFVTEVVLAYLNGGGERDAGRAAFQIALTVDPHGGAVMHAGGEAIAATRRSSRWLGAMPSTWGSSTGMGRRSGRHRPSRHAPGVRSCSGMAGAARCRAARTTRTPTSITSRRGARAGRMTPTS